MILFIEIVVVLGLIAFPIVKTYFKGVVEWMWVQGIVVGVNSGAVIFSALVNKEKKIFKMYSIQFHILIITVSMCFSIEKPDYETKEE
jgi:hypothetical protein